MSRFTASQARQNFARVLDQAAGGQSVTIERGKLGLAELPEKSVIGL
jgi:antitoxin (DNA-binding transcriptional repressor) of toxin-antitoxin stability system